MSDGVGTSDPLGAIEVVNVDTWGSGACSLSGGTVLPADAPPGDMDWAREHRVIVSGLDFKASHPDWTPDAPQAPFALSLAPLRRASADTTEE